MNIPKSLHTITAIVAIARHLNAAPHPCECTQLARRAAEILGYPADVADTYQLIERAALILKGKK